MQTSLPQYLALVNVPASFSRFEEGLFQCFHLQFDHMGKSITKNVPMQDFLRLTDRPSPWLYKREDPVRNNMVLFYEGGKRRSMVLSPALFCRFLGDHLFG